MAIVEARSRVTLRNILYLTDFSEPSDAALPFATAIAREYGAKVLALHVMMPVPMAYATPESAAAMIGAQEENAQAEMQRLEARLAGLAHETILERGLGVWECVEQAIRDYGIELIVLGTHGRTGAQKLLLGSVAEEIFRHANVPVLTIGPQAEREAHTGGKFRTVLFATDFTPESVAAAPYAVSMAEENQAHLVLLHVVSDSDKRVAEQRAASALEKLREFVSPDAELWCRPEPIVRVGNPAAQIIEEAGEADLIVMGVRSAAGHLGAATHLERTTAHKVVVQARCPVLTVRG